MRRRTMGRSPTHDCREQGKLNMAPRNSEVLKKHKTVADANVAKGHRRRLNREALYKTNGGFEPSRPPNGSGPPYDPAKMRRIATPAKPHRG